MFCNKTLAYSTWTTKNSTRFVLNVNWGDLILTWNYQIPDRKVFFRLLVIFLSAVFFLQFFIIFISTVENQSLFIIAPCEKRIDYLCQNDDLQNYQNCRIERDTKHKTTLWQVTKWENQIYTIIKFVFFLLLFLLLLLVLNRRRRKKNVVKGTHF